MLKIKGEIICKALFFFKNMAELVSANVCDNCQNVEVCQPDGSQIKKP